jgi:hypothetical protein
VSSRVRNGQRHPRHVGTRALPDKGCTFNRERACPHAHEGKRGQATPSVWKGRCDCCVSESRCGTQYCRGASPHFPPARPLRARVSPRAGNNDATPGTWGHVPSRCIPPCALFLSNRGRRITPRQVARRLDGWLARAGIGKRLSPHGLRHTFATRLYDAAPDLLVVQRALADSIRWQYESGKCVSRDVSHTSWRSSIATAARCAASRPPGFTPASSTAGAKRRSNASESRPAFPRSLACLPKARRRQVEPEVLIKPLDELVEELPLLVVEILVSEDAMLDRIEVTLGRPGALLRRGRAFVPAPSLDVGFFGSAQGHFRRKLLCPFGLRGGRQKQPQSCTTGYF